MARRSLGSTFSLSNLFNRFWTSAVALLGSTRRSCAVTHPRQINHGASCLVVPSTRQAAKWCPSTVGKNMALVFNFVELGPDILECDASWYIPVIGRAQVFKKLPG